MLEVVGSSQKEAIFKNFKILKFLKIASFWLEPTTSNIKLTMTSHSYKEFKASFFTFSLCDSFS